MARIRTIKPEFPQSESMGRVSRDARLLFIELWTIADDSGRLRGNSRMLASLLFPYDDDAPNLMEGWLGELDREGCILRYSIEGNAYIQICKWQEHQKIDKPTPSKIPQFDESSRILASNSRDVVLGKEGKGRERKGKDQGEEKEPSPRKRSSGPKVKNESDDLEVILSGGKGTFYFEAYWKLVKVFGPAKNPSPKITARLFMSATVGYSPEHIQDKAEALAKATGDPKYLPQLAKWLEGQGYLNPDQNPQQRPSNGNHHRSASDQALLDQLAAEAAG